MSFLETYQNITSNLRLKFIRSMYYIVYIMLK
jgi:hypothetical protein